MNKWVSRSTPLLAAALIAGGIGFWAGSSLETGEEAAPVAEAERRPLFYRNPMNPEITSPVPAKDSMGMDYIPVFADDDDWSAPAGTVRIDPVTTQSIGVRTSSVQRRSLSRDIRTVGRVDFDEQRIVRLHPKTEGWIESLHVETTGQLVEADDVLLSIYSPRLVSSQQEYLLAMRNFETLKDSPFEDVRNGAARLMAGARERLELMDVPPHQLQELEISRTVMRQLHIHSPAPGTVIRVGVREGQYVTPQTELYFLADLTRVWVLVDIFENELPWVRVGDPAEMTVDGVPGRTFRGTLSYVYPYAERRTRTVKARLEFANVDHLLKPEMYADVTIRAQARTDALAVPSEAIVRSGLRDQVFIETGQGRFEPREIVAGLTSEGWTEIRRGVEAGESVVVSAQFLIDSESKLREAASKMREIDDD